MTCFRMVRGTRLRVTQLDECGNPDGLYVVTKGFVQVALSSEIEAGDEFVEKNADGDLCINERSPDNLKRLTAEIDWCEVDPDLISIITGFPVEEGESPGDSVGIRVEEGPLNSHWALEMWTRLTGGACGEDGQCYGYYLIPFLTGGMIGDQTIANAAATFQTTGSYTSGGSGWGVGPWDVIGTDVAPTPLDDPITAVQHELLRVTCVAPPEPSCGAAAIPTSPTSP